MRLLDMILIIFNLLINPCTTPSNRIMLEHYPSQHSYYPMMSQEQELFHRLTLQQWSCEVVFEGSVEKCKKRLKSIKKIPLRYNAYSAR